MYQTKDSGVRMQRDDDPNKEPWGYTTKDSGVRSEYATGMVRDTQAGKARWDLLFPRGIPYAKQMLTRFADLMARGADKYTERNWEKARTQEELDRYHSSALRHLIQWISDESDEDHAAGVMFNIMAGEFVKEKMVQDEPTDSVHDPADLEPARWRMHNTGTETSCANIKCRWHSGLRGYWWSTKLGRWTTKHWRDV